MTYRLLRSLILCLALLWSLGKPDGIHAETNDPGAPEETNAKGTQAKPAAPTLSLKLQAAGSPAVVGVKRRIAADPFNWRLYTELGAVFYKEGRYDESIAAYQQALAMNPFSRTIEAERQQQELVAAQRQAHEQQQAAQALGLVFGALGGVGGTVGGMGGQALQLAGTIGQMGAGLGNVAAQLAPGGPLDSQIKVKQETAQVYHSLGEAYMAKGDHNQAAKSFEESLTLDPSRMASLQSSGSAYLQLAEYDKAAATLNRLLVLNPADPHPILFLWLSLAYKHQGKNREEAEAHEVAMKRLHALALHNSKDMATLNSVADSYFELSYYQDAVKMYEQSLALRKDQPVVLRRLGISYYALGRHADAARVLKEATLLVRNDSSSWLWLGRSLEKLGASGEAQAAFNEAIASDADDWGNEPPPVPVAAAYASRANGDNRISIGWLEELAFRHPTSSYRAFELGLAYEKAARYEDALDIFERSVSLNPLDNLAREALERVGRTLEQRAREDLGKADVALAGNRSSEAITHLSSALQRLPQAKARQDALLKLLRLVANMPSPPPLTEQGERHFARGNTMLKSATGPEGVDRAIMEFRSAIRRSPWWTNSYLNLGLAYAQRRLYRDATLYFKLYLIANPNAKNVGAVREQIYELEYKQEQEQRLPPLLSRLRYKRDYGEIRVQPPAKAETPAKEKTPPETLVEQGGSKE